MDRLLSEQEFDQIVLDKQYKTRGERVMALLKAQLAKTDAEWVECLEKQQKICNAGQCRLGKDKLCYFVGPTCGWWQARKKEVGL
jgi:hypothetical protein